MILRYIFYFLLAYLSGGIMFGYWIPKIFCGLDVRGLRGGGGRVVAGAEGKKKKRNPPPPCWLSTYWWTQTDSNR